MNFFKRLLISSFLLAFSSESLGYLIMRHELSNGSKGEKCISKVSVEQYGLSRPQQCVDFMIGANQARKLSYQDPNPALRGTYSFHCTDSENVSDYKMRLEILMQMCNPPSFFKDVKMEGNMLYRHFLVQTEDGACTNRVTALPSNHYSKTACEIERIKMEQKGQLPSQNLDVNGLVTSFLACAPRSSINQYLERPKVKEQMCTDEERKKSRIFAPQSGGAAS